MLIPMFLIIGIWGGPRRVYATLKFFLYTFLGSVFMLVALIYLYVKAGDYSIASFQALPLTLMEQRWIFVAFLLAFAVKVPMWPVHTWLPDAHVEAPTGGSVILAAIMLKMGGYGFLRFSLPIAPGCQPRARPADHRAVADRGGLHRLRRAGAGGHEEADRLFVDRAHGLRDARASSSCTRSCARTGSVQGAGMGMDGAMVQMISHGLVSGAMFLCVGVLYDRMHTAQIADYGGVVNTMPIFAAFMVLFALANCGLPGTSGFVGEFLVILASFKASFWYAFLAAVTLILGAAYTLWLVKRVVFGAVGNDHVAALQDLNGREFVVLGVLALAVLLVGIWPAPLLKSCSRRSITWSTRPSPPRFRFERTAPCPMTAVMTWSSIAARDRRRSISSSAICVVLLVDVFAGEKRPRADLDADAAGARGRARRSRCVTAM